MSERYAYTPVSAGLQARDRLLARARWEFRKALTPALRSLPLMDTGPRSRIRLAGVGSVQCGRKFRCHGDLNLVVQGKLVMGDKLFVGRWVTITCFESIEIGDQARLGERVSIHDENHVSEPLSDLHARFHEYDVGPIVIGARAWLGANVVVLAGVSIGADTVVAAGSVVTRDLPPGVLAAGAPARVVRTLVP